MTYVANVLLDIFIIFLVAKVAGEIFSRLDQPPVIGELLAGVLIGPYALGLFGTPDPALVQLFQSEEAARQALDAIYEVLAQVGAIVLLFFVGLETQLSDMKSVGLRSAVVGAMGILLPFIAGFAFVTYRGGASQEALFLGTAMVATSVGITARVLSDLGVTRTAEARIILGAAVVDDILGMILLAVVVGLGTAGVVSGWHIALVAIEAIAFAAFVVLVGTRAIRRYSIHFEALRMRNAPFVVAMATCLGLAALASYIGLAAIIGAFLAGMVFAETRDRHSLIKNAQPVYDFLVPFFFVVTGAQVDLHAFVDGRVVGFALAVTVLAIIGKLVGCSIGAWGLSLRSIATIGVGMVPRGEVGLIVAAIGLSLNAISDELFSVVVAMSVLTTVMAPPLLKWLYSDDYQSRQPPPASESRPSDDTCDSDEVTSASGRGSGRPAC
ncbi:MAG: cation:proton antiporter [Chloroflexi bacterium]|nr:cation:proton antiporter [Chloroflexota bacterium]